MKEKPMFSVTKKDLKIEYFSGKGAGGQHRNKHQNCVRIHHKDSGALVTGQSHRERQANQDEAFKNLVNNTKFKLWHARRVQECQEGKTLEQKVKEMVVPKNLKIEIKENGKWVEE